MKKSAISLLTGLALAGFSAGCATTNGGGIHSGSVVVANEDTRIAVSFNEHDRDRIRRYYAGPHQGLPPGLAKKHKIPPGHARKIERHQRLPPGLDWHHLPHDLEEHLARLPENYVRVKVGTDVVLMDRDTRVVFDIIYDVGE